MAGISNQWQMGKLEIYTQLKGYDVINKPGGDMLDLK